MVANFQIFSFFKNIETGTELVFDNPVSIFNFLKLTANFWKLWKPKDMVLTFLKAGYRLPPPLFPTLDHHNCHQAPAAFHAHSWLSPAVDSHLLLLTATRNHHHWLLVATAPPLSPYSLSNKFQVFGFWNRGRNLFQHLKIENWNLAKCYYSYPWLFLITDTFLIWLETAKLNHMLSTMLLCNFYNLLKQQKFLLSTYNKLWSPCPENWILSFFRLLSSTHLC